MSSVLHLPPRMMPGAGGVRATSFHLDAGRVCAATLPRSCGKWCLLEMADRCDLNTQRVWWPYVELSATCWHAIGVYWSRHSHNPFQNLNAMSAKSNIVILLATLAAGAAVGMLLAPSSGKDTRKKLVKKSNDLHDRLRGMLDEGCELIEKLKGDATGLAGEARHTVKDAAGSIRDTARSMYKG
ncbi:MAG: YtxH domain-containing protein [Flavobacteriales bacterium]